MEKMLERLHLMCYNLPRRKNNYVYYSFYSTSSGYRRPLEFNQLCSCFRKDFSYSGKTSQNIFGQTNQRVRQIRQNNPRSKKSSSKTQVKLFSPKVVIDSNVYFTAAKSPYGNSGELINLARRKKIKVFISDYILNEAIENLRIKSTTNACKRHSKNISYIHPKKFLPQETLIQAYNAFIEKDDAPILALASFIKADFLITLNTKHFIKNPKLELLDLPFKCITPGNFIVLMGKKKVRS